MMKLYPKQLAPEISEYKDLMADRCVCFSKWEHCAEAIKVYREWEKNVRVEEMREQCNAKRLFLENIQLLLDHSDTILADSRMALAMLPDAGGLAYVGGIFYKPTLATYLEWWRTCKDSHLIIKGKEYWIYYLSGSIMSGVNKCTAISADGDTTCVRVKNFKKTWHSFININRKYRDLPRFNEHYPLPEVIGILKDEK